MDTPVAEHPAAPVPPVSPDGNWLRVGSTWVRNPHGTLQVPQPR